MKIEEALKITDLTWAELNMNLINCPKCGSDTVEDQTDDYDAKSGRSSDESDPIYFDMCPKCGWNNGPKN